jgi:hypothetical protein
MVRGKQARFFQKHNKNKHNKKKEGIEWKSS